MMEKQLRGEATDSAIDLVIAAERQRCIDRVLTYATLRDQARVGGARSRSANFYDG